MGRVEVGDHRHRRCTAARFPHRHANTRQGQGPEVTGKAAEHGHHAPECAAPADQVAAVASVGKPPQGYRKQAVDQGKGQPRQQADLGVGNVKLGFDRLNHNAHDLAVDQADRRNQE